MDIKSILIQFAFLYAPFIHCPTERVAPNIYRGGDPKTRDIYMLRDKGIKTIISLRVNPQKNKTLLCEKLGMQWVHIPTGIFLTPKTDEFDHFRAVVNNPKNLPCYMACEVDMDRTGVYIAVYRMVDQYWSIEQVKEEFRQHHQKKWWPPFWNYAKAVEEYAKNHKDLQLIRKTH
jgi:hypothetical protein